MVAVSTILLASLPIAAFAGNQNRGSLRSKHQQHARRLQSRTKTYKLTDMYKGEDFLNNWDFFEGGDPTHGRVDFLSRDDATKAGLMYVQSDNTTVIAVDNTTKVDVGANRKSVRISSKKKYSKGLFIADFWAMPTGCGTWPAYWTVGPNWPQAGEIDIIEGVNNQATNQFTLHSGDGCTLDKNPPVAQGLKAFTANILGTQCASTDDSNAGCGFSGTDNNTFGSGFNSVGGGLYVHLWDNSSITMWHFARNEIPQDITAGNPDPSSWPTPAALWSSSTCDISSHFYDHVLTLDTTLCGDWASSAYPSSGCPGTCDQAVADPTNFDDARWKVNYIAVYN